MPSKPAYCPFCCWLTGNRVTCAACGREPSPSIVEGARRFLKALNPLNRIYEEIRNMATKIEDFRAEFRAYVSDVRTKLADLGEKIDKLSTALADDASEDATIDALMEDVKAAHAELNGTAIQPPVVPPAEGGGGGGETGGGAA